MSNITQRPISEGAERILRKYFQVLDHGFVSLVDYCGTDQCIEAAARVSYSGGGTRAVSQTNNLLRYLKRQDHNTPFEMVELKFHCCMPTFIARQWIRHRTACLSSDVELWFDEPAALLKGKRKIRKIKISEFFDKWQNANKRSRLKLMNLRSLDENNKNIISTKVTDIWSNGIKDVFKVTFENGYSIKMTKDHLCFTDDGWKTLEDATKLSISRDGNVSWSKESAKFATNGIPSYQLFDWMKEHRDKGLNVSQIANEAGVSYHTIRKWLRIHKLQFSPKEKAKFSGATQKGTKRLGKPRGPLTGDALKNLLKARSGSASNFWKGGISKDRASIGRWTREKAKFVHEKFNFQCQICSSKDKLEAHHLDPVWNNIDKARSIDNLISLCKKCHKNLHSKNRELDLLNFVVKNNTAKGFVLFDKLPRPDSKKLPKVKKLSCNFMSVQKIEYIGQEEVFDLSVEGPNHNFVANGVVVHNSVNEMSGRYSLLPMMFYSPDQSRLQTQSKDNKQGSSGNTISNELFAEYTEKMNQLRDDSIQMYTWLNQNEVARELARIDLPLSFYTQWYWKIDLHNLFHFLKLRVDSHAQWEIQQYGKIIAGMVKEIAPYAYEAWLDYDVCGTKLSAGELSLIQDLVKVKDGGIYTNGDRCSDPSAYNLSSREVTELLGKLSPKARPDFTLDLNSAKEGSFFEEKMSSYIPK